MLLTNEIHRSGPIPRFLEDLFRRKPLQYLRRSIPQLYLYYRESPRKIVCLPGMRFHHQREKTYETRELRQFTRICPCGKRYCCIPMDFGCVLSPTFRQTQLLCPTISSIPSTSIRPLPFLHLRHTACISLSCTSSSSAAAWPCGARFQGLVQNPTKKPEKDWSEHAETLVSCRCSHMLP